MNIHFGEVVTSLFDYQKKEKRKKRIVYKYTVL